MKISGEVTLHGPVEQVYSALTDPVVLVRTIPGCERLEQVGPDAYTMVVTAGVAAIKGTYAGEVVLTDPRPPHEFVLKASGSGAPGTAAAEARIQLTGGDNGTTRVSYQADVVVGGMVGGVGQRVLTGVARKMAGEFFTAVDGVLTGVGDVLTGVGDVPAGTGPGLAGTAPAESAGAGGPAVFTRPGAPARAGGVLSGASGGVLSGGSFAAGVVFGALAGLIGVVVGGLLARRPGRPRKQ